ncbi:transketolase [Sphingomonas sp. BK036]|uniref:transketolase n=1 Tax=Sphingomonas sp. BK036 TaxID=2512122 RepID=UPI001029EF8C|nr:transketolase [Sphingomonas sp. BK036]RZT44865.1 transketolase [Sphingomonas sp. BK036]
MQAVPDPTKTNFPFAPARLRRTVLDMAYAGQTVHIGCAFSIIELLAVLYRNHLQFSPTDPASPGRDMLVLSKGHGVMAQYACMREIGWIDDAAVSGYFADGSTLKGLSDSRVPGLEVTSGSLGHGLSIAVGMALGARRNGSNQRVFCIVGDGEMNEGPNWEAMLFAPQHKLDNLVVIIDENGFQAMGRTDEIIALGDLATKFAAFGFDAVTIDGHDEAAIDDAVTSLLGNGSGRPKAIIAKTIKGYGVPFMENDNIWHYTRLTDQTYQAAIAALEEAR